MSGVETRRIRSPPCRALRVATAGVAVLVLATSGEAQPVPGSALYETRCSPCHGTEGRGDGPAATAIVPPPRNFRAPEFWRGRTTLQLRLVVEQGRPGTMMAPFGGVLSEREIDDVVAFLETFRPPRR